MGRAHVVVTGMSQTVKVVEIVGNSEESWDDAAQNALDDASESLENISGIEMVSHTADVEDGEITSYKATLHVSFALNR